MKTEENRRRSPEARNGQYLLPSRGKKGKGKESTAFALPARDSFVVFRACSLFHTGCFPCPRGFLCSPLLKWIRKVFAREGDSFPDSKSRSNSIHLVVTSHHLPRRPDYSLDEGNVLRPSFPGLPEITPRSILILPIVPPSMNSSKRALSPNRAIFRNSYYRLVELRLNFVGDGGWLAGSK